MATTIQWQTFTWPDIQSSTHLKRCAWSSESSTNMTSICPNTWCIGLGWNNKLSAYLCMKKDTLSKLSYAFLSMVRFFKGWSPPLHFSIILYSAFSEHELLLKLEENSQHSYLPHAACKWSVHLTSSLFYAGTNPPLFLIYLSVPTAKLEALWWQGQSLLASISRAHNFLSITGTH